jgi:hypothetical protein
VAAFEIPDVVRTGLSKAEEAVKSGLGFVQSSWNALPFFASVEAATLESGEERDETHYFLVPYRLDPCGYALYTRRRVPEGYAQANDLPRLRVFHLPGEGAERVLEELILRQIKGEAAREAPVEGESAGDRLERLADEIDTHSRYVTGGFLLVGGVAAIFNPLLGAGIAIKALFPSLGAALSREGLKHVGGKLKSWASRRQEAAHEQQAQEEYAGGGEIRSLVNPLLEATEKALKTTEAQYDPLLEFRFEDFTLGDWDPWDMVTLSARAVSDVYRPVLGDATRHQAARLGSEDVRWLELVASYGRRSRDADA